MSMEQKQAFDHWAIVEVFGHQTYAGRVTEQSIGGSSFVRVDVPKVDELQPFTKLFGQGAIYGITIVDEETAKIKAASIRQRPITEWEVGPMIREAVEQKLLSAKQIEDHSQRNELDEFDELT